MSDGFIILFDGVCGFCNRAVRFVIQHDKRSVYRFAPLQSGVAQSLLAFSQLNITDLSTFVLIEEGKIYTKSTAALKVCRRLNGLWSLMYIFIIIPKKIRDSIYDWVARNRYKLAGKESCMIPGAEMQTRFLNDSL